MEMLQLNDLHKTFNPGTVNEKVALGRKMEAFGTWSQKLGGFGV